MLLLSEEELLVLQVGRGRIGSIQGCRTGGFPVVEAVVLHVNLNFLCLAGRADQRSGVIVVFGEVLLLGQDVINARVLVQDVHLLGGWVG